MSFDPAAYGPVFAHLLAEERDHPLDAGKPNEAARKDLEGLTEARAFPGEVLADADMARGCVSAVHLYHNFLDTSHTISQGILTPTGSYWHGLMHRREPDFENSKYWFRKVGAHPVFAAVHEASRRLAAESPIPEAAFLTEQDSWDPFRFIDLCKGGLSGKNGAQALCRAVQKQEWQILFDYTYRMAVGT
jgi:hypothetical protein